MYVCIFTRTHLYVMGRISFGYSRTATRGTFQYVAFPVRERPENRLGKEISYIPFCGIQTKRPIPDEFPRDRLVPVSSKNMSAPFIFLSHRLLIAFPSFPRLRDRNGVHLCLSETCRDFTRF